MNQAVGFVPFKIEHEEHGDAEVVVAYKKGDYTRVGYFTQRGETYQEDNLIDLIENGWRYGGVL